MTSRSIRAELTRRRIQAQIDFWRGCETAKEVARKSYSQDERDAAALALDRPDLVCERQDEFSIPKPRRSPEAQAG